MKKPSPLSTRHEKFCQGVASGESASAAYFLAGYSKNGAGQSAERLLKNADVSRRIKELRQESEKGMEFDRMDYLETLKERFLTLSPNDPVCARYGEMLAKAQGWNEPEKVEMQQSTIVVTIGGDAN
jgi:phage terminase small subunit